MEEISQDKIDLLIKSDLELSLERAEKLKKWEEEQSRKDRKEKYRAIKDQFLSMIAGQFKNISGATEVITQYILKNYSIYTTKDDNKSEMWIYKEGVYLPQGKSEIKEIMRDILEEWFNAFYYNQVLVKIEADTYIDSQKFFNQNYVYEIPLQNGILDVRTRTLSPFSTDKIFFNKLPVTYNPHAECPSIDKFLSEVLSNPEDKQVFYELAGFALVKEYIYEKAFMFVGGGRNGKGKTIELLKRLIGAQNCSSLPLSLLFPESFAVSDLFGKMLNLAGDIGNTDFKDTSTFKGLTGRDIITGQRKFLNGLVFQNYAKFVFACNELPNVSDMSRGFWDRWILLEFPYTFVTQEEYDTAKDKAMLKIKDDYILDKIVTEVELSGLLNAGLDGLDRLTKNRRFSTTSGTKEVKDLWIRKSNSFIAFAYDFLEEDYDHSIPKKELRKRYSVYSKKHGVMSKSDFVIKKVLQEMFGVSDEKVGYPDQVWVWQGVKWKNSI